MQKPFWLKLAPLVLAGALALSGCGGAKKADGTPPPAAAETKQEKPPLDVPTSFASVEEQRQFLAKAVYEQYYEETKPLLEKLVEQTPTAGSYMLLGTTRYNLKDYQGAIDAWSKGATLDVTLSAEVRNNVGNALRDSGKNGEAMNAYNEALKLDSGYWQAAINLADLLRGQGNLSEAVAVLETAKANNSDVAVLSSMLDTYRSALKNTTGS